MSADYTAKFGLDEIANVTVRSWTGSPDIRLTFESSDLRADVERFGPDIARIYGDGVISFSVSLGDVSAFARSCNHAARIAMAGRPEWLPEKKETRPGDFKQIMPARRQTEISVAPDGTVIVKQITEAGETVETIHDPDDEEKLIDAIRSKFAVARTLRTPTEPKGPQPLASKLKPTKN